LWLAEYVHSQRPSKPLILSPLAEKGGTCITSDQAASLIFAVPSSAEAKVYKELSLPWTIGGLRFDMEPMLHILIHSTCRNTIATR